MQHQWSCSDTHLADLPVMASMTVFISACSLPNAIRRDFRRQGWTVPLLDSIAVDRRPQACGARSRGYIGS